MTDLEIRALKVRERSYKKVDERGLYIEVPPSGSKLWRVKCAYLGKEKRIALGRYPEVGLVKARDKRDEMRQKLRDRINPLAECKRAKLLAVYNAANTFDDIAREYMAKMAAEGQAETTTAKAHWLLEQLSPLAGEPIGNLKAIDVLAALKRIEAKGKYETARRCRSFAGRVFRYAIATARAESDPTAFLRGALVTPKTKHHGAILDPKAMGELLRAIDTYGGHGITRLAVQLSPHLMARPGELRQAIWPEFDLGESGLENPCRADEDAAAACCSLVASGIGYLAELYPLTGPDGYVFPAFHTYRRPLSENTVNQVFRRLGYAAGEVTAHGLRTTASTLLNESGKWSADAIERSLAHADKGAVRGIYNRGTYWEERVAMPQWWSDYLDALRDGEAEGRDTALA